MEDLGYEHSIYKAKYGLRPSEHILYNKTNTLLFYTYGTISVNGKNIGSNKMNSHLNIHIDKTNRKFIYKTKQEHIELDI
jgi:hypothetical protein